VNLKLQAGRERTNKARELVSEIVSAEQIEQLKNAGFVIVPIEPDLNMKVASVDVLKHYDESVHSFRYCRMALHLAGDAEGRTEVLTL
jgi:hypothetical protein